MGKTMMNVIEYTNKFLASKDPYKFFTTVSARVNDAGSCLTEDEVTVFMRVYGELRTLLINTLKARRPDRTNVEEGVDELWGVETIAIWAYYYVMTGDPHTAFQMVPMRGALWSFGAGPETDRIVSHWMTVDPHELNA